ncbi:unnamed protein product [Trichobilharzia regenti]|nr:unnamed protein product [Trichobilharzia regenti]
MITVICSSISMSSSSSGVGVVVGGGGGKEDTSEKKNSVLGETVVHVTKDIVFIELELNNFLLVAILCSALLTFSS